MKAPTDVRTQRQIDVVYGYILAYLGGRKALEAEGFTIGKYYEGPLGVTGNFFFLNTGEPNSLITVTYTDKDEFVATRYIETDRDINHRWVLFTTITLLDPNDLRPQVTTMTGKAIGEYHPDSIPYGYDKDPIIIV